MKVLSGSSTMKISGEARSRLTARSISAKPSGDAAARLRSPRPSRLDRRPSAAAAAATSSNSGCTLTTSPSSRATFTGTASPATSTVVHLAVQRVLVHPAARAPDRCEVCSVDLPAYGVGPRRRATRTLQRVRRAALLHQDRGEPGVASAPAAISAASTSGQTRGSRSSTFVSSTHGRVRRRPAAAAVGLAATDEQPQHVGVRLGVVAARLRRRRRGPTSAAGGPHASAERGQQRSAGGRAQLASRSPGRRRRHSAQQPRAPPAPAPEARRARSRTVPPPERDRRDEDASTPSVCEARAHADDVGDRVERADLVEVHVVRADAVGRGPRPGPAARRRRAPGRAPASGRPAPSSSARTSRPGAVGASVSATRRAHRSRRSPARSPARACSCDRPAPTASTAACSTSSGTPASTQRAEQHVAAGAGGGVDPDRSRRGSAGARGAPGDPGREARRRRSRCRCCTTATPGAHEFSIASRAASPPNDGAVPDAGRHGDERDAGQPADHAGQRALHAGDDDEAVGRVEPVADLEQPVQPGHADVARSARPRRRAPRR